MCKIVHENKCSVHACRVVSTVGTARHELDHLDSASLWNHPRCVHSSSAYLALGLQHSQAASLGMQERYKPIAVTFPGEVKAVLDAEQDKNVMQSLLKRLPKLKVTSGFCISKHFCVNNGMIGLNEPDLTVLCIHRVRARLCLLRKKPTYYAR